MCWSGYFGSNQKPRWKSQFPFENPISYPRIWSWNSSSCINKLQLHCCPAVVANSIEEQLHRSFAVFVYQSGRPTAVAIAGPVGLSGWQDSTFSFRLSLAWFIQSMGAPLTLCFCWPKFCAIFHAVYKMNEARSKQNKLRGKTLYVFLDSLLFFVGKRKELKKSFCE